MTLRSLLGALASFAMVAGTAIAHDYVLGDLTIGHPYALETRSSAKSGAGYLTIENSGNSPDRLISVKSPFPIAQIYTSEIGADGVARMSALETLDIPASATVTLTPGGMHVMFMGLTSPMQAGNRIPVTLVFEHAGAVDLDFEIQARSADDPMAMPDMKH